MVALSAAPRTDRRRARRGGGRWLLRPERRRRGRDGGPVLRRPRLRRRCGACALLLPAAATELELDIGEPCDEAVLDPAQAGGVLGGRAAAARVEEVHRAGGQAQVVTAGDTVFLALSGDRWVVTAVGCDARGDRPYECAVES